ncbi:hypothetical protein LCGC14_3088060, partial [marine sediment metagenome]
TVQSNSPVIFFQPVGNFRNEPFKTKAGYSYPSSDPGSIKEIKFSPPDVTLLQMMEKAENMGQVLFGISNFSAGVESTIDPTGPAKKAEIVVAQGNVRLNIIIKRKNKTLQDIFTRWFLLYQANMPPNKFARIAGEDRDNPWKFEAINMTDFALKSIPDFELTGNVLNANKALEVNKILAVYQLFIANPFFAPQTAQGLQALHGLTKLTMDKLDETGLSNFLPPIPGDVVETPEEENARFLQGDEGEPQEGEDHVGHIKTHNIMLFDPTVPEDIRQEVAKHISIHVDLLKKQITQQIVMSQLPPQGGQGGGQPGLPGQAGAPQNVLPGARLERPQAGNQAGVI